MRFEEVHFKKFSVQPDKIFNSLPDYAPPYWPLDWEIAVVSGLETESVYAWAKTNLAGSMDVFNSYDGTILVGFSDQTDSVLFKISYTPPKEIGFK